MSSRPFKKLLSTLQLTTDYSAKPAGLQWRSNTLFIVATVAVGLFCDMFLYGLIGEYHHILLSFPQRALVSNIRAVPILPFMLEDRVHLPEDQVQSAVAGLLASYAGASVLFSPIAGVLADKTSTRQLPFLLGLAALFCATILLFAGTSMPVLIIARVLQGMTSLRGQGDSSLTDYNPQALALQSCGPLVLHFAWKLSDPRIWARR